MFTFMAQNPDIIIAFLGTIVAVFGYLTVRGRIQLGNVQSSQKHQSEQLQLMKDMMMQDAQYRTQQMTAQTERENTWNISMSAREEVWRQTIKELATSFTVGLENLILEQRHHNVENQKQSVASERTMQLVAQTTGNLTEVLRTQVGTTERMEQQLTELHAVTLGSKQEIRDWVFNLNDNSDHLLKTVEAIRDHVIKVLAETLPKDVKNSLQEIKDIVEKTYQRLETSHEKTIQLPTFAAIDAVLYGSGDVDDTHPGTGNNADNADAGILLDPGS